MSADIEAGPRQRRRFEAIVDPAAVCNSLGGGARANECDQSKP
jgi:hypothetical protein